jgi:phosphoglycolate phosphatase-like HAD superfamily hydrolase
VGALRAVAVDLDGALGDTRPLWRAWLSDAGRRYRVEGLERLSDDPAAAPPELDRLLGNWEPLLERFAEEHAGLQLRPRSEVSAALRRLQAGGVRVGAFSDVPEPLASVAAAHLGVARRLEALEAGAGALDRLLARLGSDARVVRTAAELTELS